MKYIKSENGFDYYIFKPNLIRQYFNSVEEWTTHRSKLSHKMHMAIYIIRGGYRILYCLKNEEVASYIVYTRCGSTIIEGTTKKDIYTIFVTTNPKFRKMGLASKIVYEMLHGIGLKYEKSYKTILESNIASQKAAFANGYVLDSYIKKTGIFKTIRKAPNSTYGLYQVNG